MDTSNQQYLRRGSVPSDLSSDLRRLDGQKSGKSRVRKNVLRRRSSGGPEMFTTSGLEPIAWRREVLARRTAEQALVRRRGSLPIEVLASHSGVVV
ncbi:hypothetical protein C0J52_25313 [Blattella germanica]|nr:hypothetical protein C0J52_25313 [Blattella germanica]